MTFAEIVAYTKPFVSLASSILGAELQLTPKIKANGRSVQFFLHLARNWEANTGGGVFVLTVLARPTLQNAN